MNKAISEVLSKAQDNGFPSLGNRGNKEKSQYVVFKIIL